MSTKSVTIEHKTKHSHMQKETVISKYLIQPSKVKSLLQSLEASPYIGNIILMTHFANADEAIGIQDQLALFNTIVDDSFDRSVANSAAIIRYPETHMEWVRPGIMLYGASPFEDQSSKDIGLQPVMSLHSNIIAVQNLDKGQSVGYGSTFVATNKMRIGIVACGYADGYPRHAPSGTPIMVDEKISRTLGRVSMDIIAIDISNITSNKMKRGEFIEIIGSNQNIDKWLKE